MSDARALGVQYAIELYGCRSDRLSDCVAVEELLRGVGRDLGATVLSSHFHQFAPGGVSGVLVISESHLAVHTWPEHGYAAVDLFTCGPRLLDGVRAAELLGGAFRAERTSVSSAERGILR